MSAEPDNVADPKKVKAKADKSKRQQDNRDEDFRWLLAQPQFRRWVWHVIHHTDYCALMQTPWNPNGSTQTLNIGMQEIGRKLHANIERIDARLIPQMMLEYHEAQTRT